MTHQKQVPLMVRQCGLAWVLLIAVTACTPDSVLPDEDLAASEPDPDSFNIDLDELDDFARDHLAEVQEISITEAVEYCGLYGYDTNGELTATPAIKGERDSCDPGEEPGGFTVIATYHTHGSYSTDADTEVPSLEDLIGDIDEQLYGYIATPGGRLWFNDWESEVAMVIDPGAIEPDLGFQDCPAFPPDIEYTVPELEERQDNDPGEC